MNRSNQEDPDFYQPDHRLADAYREATSLDEEGLEALCPSYIELSESAVRYRDDTLIGEGAVKEVHRTYDNRTKRWVAMAKLRAERGPEFYDLFVHEAWLTSSLSHPNIINVHDAGVDGDGRPFFTMDLKGNTTLADLTETSEKKDLCALLEIFIKVCDAVAYAHSSGVIHLDLKPENIQTDAFGEVLVCDWGLGKVLGESEEGENEIPETNRPFDNMTLVGQIKGTPGYMAPEQVIPGSTKDHRTDIFALGCILHLILTGDAPFTGSQAEILEATSAAIIVPPREQYPLLEIPEGLEAVAMKSTSKEPEERYASALMLKEEIRNYLSGFATRAENPGFFREARLFLMRNRLPSAITFLALIAIIVLSMLYSQHLERQRQVTASFETKADKATGLYLDELARSEEHRVKLSQRLAISANHLKNLGIFERPAATVAEASNLAATALALNPKCADARYERFSLNMITLNFKAALAHPPPPDSKGHGYIKFAEAFPDFDFTRKSRPSPAQFSAFLRKAREINPDQGPLMERIVSYDSAIRRKGSYEPIMASLLEYLNGGKQHVAMTYRPIESSLLIKSDQDLQLIVSLGGSNKCILRYLQVRSLVLEIDGKFPLSDLESLPIKSLDLRGCRNVLFGKPVSLPGLTEVHVRQGQVGLSKLRQRIKTSGKFRVVVQPQ